MSPLEQLHQIEVSINALEERLQRVRWWEWGTKRDLRLQMRQLRWQGDRIHSHWIRGEPTG